MNTKKMISDIKSVCADLETEKNHLLNRIREIEESLTAYRTAISGLEAVACHSVPDSETAESCAGSVHKRETAVLEYNGVTRTVSEWAKLMGIDVHTLRARLKNGVPVNEALSRPVGNSGPKSGKKKQHRIAKVFAYDSHGNVMRQYVSIGAASHDMHIPVAVLESTIANVSTDDQLKAHGYYLAYV